MSVGAIHPPGGPASTPERGGAAAPGVEPGRSWLPDELAGAIAAGALLLASFVLGTLVGGEVATAAGHAAGWASLAIGMVYGGRAALEALRARTVDIDVLMVVAAGLAAVVGHPEDGALLLFLFVLAGALEDRAMRRTMRAVEALHKLMPTAALAWRGGAWAPVRPEELAAGERVLVRTGELVPADARIEQGQTSLDQATLTGESLPRSAGVGDEIYAGTLNVGHPVEAVVTRPAKDSSLQRILDLVTTAQQQREPLQRLIDRFSEPYAIGVMALSVVVGLVWWGVLGFEAKDAAYTAIALLIVASPCALVIATPTATLAAISRAARGGLLFKGGQAIERLANLGAVALDKTGTITFGRPRLHQVHAVGWSDGKAILAAAAALESGSTHPIAVAVVEAARSRGASIPDAIEIEDLPGRGLSGRIDAGAGAHATLECRLGTLEHCAPLIPVCLRGRVGELLETVRGRGQIGVVVALAGRLTPQHESPDAGHAGVLILSDTIRPGAADMVAGLHALGVRPIRMLTGDHPTTARHVASRVGIDRFDAKLLPEDKVRLLEEMKLELRGRVGGWGAATGAVNAAVKGAGRGVGVIGDGVNDAPALAAADVSIAIGSIGSDAALESADIVLLHEDLRVIPWGVRLARRTRAIVKFNILFALGIIAFMGALTLAGSLVGRPVPLALAVLAHEGGTLLVVANSLRLLMARRDRAVEGGPAEVAEVVVNHPAAAA